MAVRQKTAMPDSQAERLIFHWKVKVKFKKMEVWWGKSLHRIKMTKLQHQTDSQAKMLIFQWKVKLKTTQKSESESFAHTVVKFSQQGKIIFCCMTKNAMPDSLAERLIFHWKVKMKLRLISKSESFIVKISIQIQNDKTVKVKLA